MDAIYNQLEAWYTTSLGKELLRAEQALLDEHLAEYFGSYLLQVGGPTHCHLSEQARMRLHYYVGARMDYSYFHSGVRAELTALPFIPNSIDLALLPHSLEFSPNPKQTLNEVYHILQPGGTIIILGFNPFSLWGLTKCFMIGQRQAPWVGHFISLLRLRTWLIQLGFTMISWKTVFFRPPFRSQRLLKRVAFLESAGASVWPLMGASYQVVAEKRKKQRLWQKEKTALVRRPRLVAGPMTRT